MWWIATCSGRITRVLKSQSSHLFYRSVLVRRHDYVGYFWGQIAEWGGRQDFQAARQIALIIHQAHGCETVAAIVAAKIHRTRLNFFSLSSFTLEERRREQVVRAHWKPTNLDAIEHPSVIRWFDCKFRGKVGRKKIAFLKALSAAAGWMSFPCRMRKMPNNWELQNRCLKKKMRSIVYRTNQRTLVPQGGNLLSKAQSKDNGEQFDDKTCFQNEDSCSVTITLRETLV